MAPGVSEGVDGAPEETWIGIEWALRKGRRGLKAGSSLARLLDKHRGVPNRRGRPRLSTAKILRLADRHHRLTGRWPNSSSGSVTVRFAETWCGITTPPRARDVEPCPGAPRWPTSSKEHRGVAIGATSPR